MKYVIMWSTLAKGADWLPFSDTPEGHAALKNALNQLMGYGPQLIWWKIFKEDTQAIFDELTKPKGGDNGGLDC